MAYLYSEDSEKVAYMCLEKQNIHEDSCILDPTMMILFMMIRKLASHL